MAARVPYLTIKQADIQRMEGLRQELVDKEAEHRPKAEAIDLVAQLLGVRRRTLREWVRKQRPLSRLSETTERFLDVFDQIVTLQCETLKAELFKMARAGERDGFRALTFLLARMDPENYDPNYQEPETEDEQIFSSADVPQEVFDGLTEEEHAQIEAMRERALAVEAEYKRLLMEAEHRLRALEIAERSGGSNDAPA